MWNVFFERENRRKGRTWPKDSLVKNGQVLSRCIQLGKGDSRWLLWIAFFIKSFTQNTSDQSMFITMQHISLQKGVPFSSIISFLILSHIISYCIFSSRDSLKSIAIDGAFLSVAPTLTGISRASVSSKEACLERKKCCPTTAVKDHCWNYIFMKDRSRCLLWFLLL